MFPCAAYPGPVVPPAQSMHSEPVYVAARPCASTTPTCRCSRPSSAPTSVAHDVLRRVALAEQRQPVRPVGEVRPGLRRDRPDLRLRGGNGRADRQELRLDGDAPLARLEVARDDRVRGDHPAILPSPRPTLSFRSDGAIRPAGDRAEVAGRCGSASARSPSPTRARRDGRGAHLRPRDAPVPVRRAAHGPREELHARRRAHPRAAAHGLPRAAADGLRRLRPSRRERRHPRGRPPAPRHRAEHRRHPRADAPHGLGDRLGPRGLDPRALLLPLDAVALPQVLRAGPGLPQGGAGQLVPQRPDRARQRAGDRRPLRALRRRGRAPEPRAVVLQDHGLRRPPARRDEPARVLARARPDDAAQLDRPLRGRRGRLPDRGARRGDPGLHDPPGHALRGDVLRALARAPARARARRGDAARGRRPRVRAPRGRALLDRARRPGEGEDRRLHGRVRHEPGQRAAHPDLGRRLRPHGVRDRRDHGRPRPRRARLRVRAAATSCR